MRVHDPDRRNLLEGKVALVTGGGGPLGLATARLFLKEGARLVLVDRNAERLQTAMARLDDVQASTVVGDATREDDVAAAVDTVVQRHGRLDVLVTAAGAPVPAAPVTEFDVERFDDTYAAQVRGVFLACKHALRVMSDGGSVVIVSGVPGLRGEPGAVAHAAAEHAQVGLMRTVAKEVAGRGIRVNTVHPGPFAGGAAGRVPLGRPVQPDEVARSVLYLASPLGSFTTASTLVVDGGLSA
jgi:NAD(P)-dependent dehydrogenase (short-subunit alcohol dehydrogenase family)